MGIFLVYLKECKVKEWMNNVVICLLIIIKMEVEVVVDLRWGLR